MWMEHINFVFLSCPTLDALLQYDMVVTSIWSIKSLTNIKPYITLSKNLKVFYIYIIQMNIDTCIPLSVPSISEPPWHRWVGLFRLFYYYFLLFLYVRDVLVNFSMSLSPYWNYHSLICSDGMLRFLKALHFKH